MNLAVPTGDDDRGAAWHNRYVDALMTGQSHAASLARDMRDAADRGETVPAAPPWGDYPPVPPDCTCPPCTRSR